MASNEDVGEGSDPAAHVGENTYTPADDGLDEIFQQWAKLADANKSSGTLSKGEDHGFRMDNVRAPMFSGEEGEDLREWLLDIDSHIRMKAIKPGAACCFMRLCTKGRARHFIDGLTPTVKDNLDQLGKALRDEYGNERMRWRALGRFWAIKQRPNQLFADYLVEMERAATRVGTLGEDEVMMAIIYGARPSIRRQLMVANVHKDMRDMREYIKKVDVDSTDENTTGGSEEWKVALRRIEAKMDGLKTTQTAGTQAMEGRWWPEQQVDGPTHQPVQMMEGTGGPSESPWPAPGNTSATAAAPKQQRVWYGRLPGWQNQNPTVDNYPRDVGTNRGWSGDYQTFWQRRNQPSYADWGTDVRQQPQQPVFNSGNATGWRPNYGQRQQWRPSRGQGGGGFEERNDYWRGNTFQDRGQFRGGRGGNAGRGNFRGNFRGQPAQRGFGGTRRDDTRYERRSSLNAAAAVYEPTTQPRSPEPEQRNDGVLFCTYCKSCLHNVECCTVRNIPRGQRECWE